MITTTEVIPHSPSLILSTETPDAILEGLVRRANNLVDPLTGPIIVSPAERLTTPPLFELVKKDVSVTPYELARPYSDDTDILERALSGLRNFPDEPAKVARGRASPVYHFAPRRPGATWDKPPIDAPYISDTPLPSGYAERPAAVAVTERPARGTAIVSTAGAAAVRRTVRPQLPVTGNNLNISPRLNAHAMTQDRKWWFYRGLRGPESLGSRLARVGRRLGVLGMTAAVSFLAIDNIANHLGN